MSWSNLVLDSSDGVRVLLRKLAGSPLVRKSLPNAAAICQQYFAFKRNPSETIGNFLVRETLVHEEFVEAIIRLHEEKEGLSQDQLDFGLPPSEDEWNDEEWNSSWGWWNHEDGYEDEEVGDVPPDDSRAPEGPAEGEPVHDGGDGDRGGAAPGSSPSHRSVGDRSPTRRSAGEAQQVGTPPTAKPAVNEMTVADSFIMGVLRGWRLLQAAGLSAEEKRDILSSTKNSLDYEVVAAALQNLWDDQLLGHRNHGSSHQHLNFMDSQTSEQPDAFYTDQDDWSWMDPGWYEGYYADEANWEDSDGWWNAGSQDWGPEAMPAVTEQAEDNDPQLKEAAKAEKIAESLAAEAQRTWSEAQRATQQLRKDRGFGAPMKCFNCGGNHMIRDCPHGRSHGYSKGKGYGKKGAFYSEYSGYPGDYMDMQYTNKGKSKGKTKKGFWSDLHVHALWKGKQGKAKGKGKDTSGFRQVNAYSSDMFVGGLELSDVFEAATSEISKPEPKPQIGMLDSGATASAAPDAVVQGLISAVLSHDRNAKIELDQGARPYFRFGNGRWGRALCRVHISSSVSGTHRTFSLYTLPNPTEYYQAGFEKSALVPVLIGMDFMGHNGAGLMVDFSRGFAMFTSDPQPEIFKLDVNHKGHYTLDIVKYLTKGIRCDEGHPHVVVRVVWFDLQASDRSLEVEKIMVASLKAKSAAAKNKAKPLDPTRVMKMDVRDPRAKATQWPCWGTHTPSAPQANLHGQWVVCAVCCVRLLYTPRQGSSSQHTTVENPGMIKRMLSELQPLMGDALPTAQICRHMLAKINAEEVLNKAIREARNKSCSSTTIPEMMTSPATTSSWEVAVPDDDEELVQAYETEAQGSITASGAEGDGYVYFDDGDFGKHANGQINFQNGYDLYHKDTWERLRELRQVHRPRRIWLSLPSSKWCVWGTMNHNSPSDNHKFEQGRRRERRLLWNVVSFLKESLEADNDLDIYFEWPHPCGGWKQVPMVELQDYLEKNGMPWLRCRIDGCNYGLRDPESGMFIRKPWLVYTTDDMIKKLPLTTPGSWCRRLLDIGKIGGDDLWKCVLEEHDNDYEHEEEECYMDAQMVEATRLGLETLCREARLRERFDMDVCENILLEFAKQAKQTFVEKKPHSRWQQSPFHILLGAYSHGAFSGVTRNSSRYPELNRYINSYLRHWLPHRRWSSIAMTLNGRTVPHTDNHNCKGTVNVIHGLGPCENGGIWLKGEPPDGYGAVRRRLPDGSLHQGYVAQTRHQFITFSPEVTHATQSWKGQRLTLTAFTTRSTPYLSSSDWTALRKLDYPLPQQYDLPRDLVELPTIKNHFSATTTTSTSDPGDSTPTVKDHFPATTATSTSDPGGHNVSVDTGDGPSEAEQSSWEAQIAKFHKAAGHPTNRNMAKIIKDAGHPEWKVQAALRHRCPACLSLKPGGTSSGQIPPASTHSLYGAWEAVGVDSAEWVPPGSKTKVKFLLFMDLATKLRMVKPLYVYDFLEMRSESGEDFLRSFAEGWLAAFPKPRLLVLDAAKSFVSDAVHEFASHANIQMSYVAEKEAWSHGVLEAGVQDVKMTASAIHLESLSQDPTVTLILASSALNATEYTGGFSSFQWAFGREYSLTDEDVRTFLTSDYQHEFVKLVQARAKAEEVARSTRAKRVLSKLANTTVRQPLREFGPMELVKVWRKVWPQQQFKGPRGGLRKSGRPHWIGPGRVVFHEVLPHQEADDSRRHIVWVLVGSQMFRCSVHSVRPVTETEKFQFETSGEDKSATWRTLSDIMPNREYVDLTDQVPDENETELPDLPQAPDKRTLVQPTRRVSRKTTLNPTPTASTTTAEATNTDEQALGTDNPSANTTRDREEGVNDYEDPEAKRPKTETTWVDELYMEERKPKDTIDVFTAFQETEEFMKIEFDLPAPESNRQRKFLERDPILYLVKKMKDSEVVLSRLPEKEKCLFQRAKMKEVDSFIKNEAVRKCLDDAELRQAMDSGRIVKARWVLTWKLVPPEDQPEAKKDSRENPQTVHNVEGTKKAKARIVLLGFQHPSLLDPSFKTASPVQSMLGRNLLYAMAVDSQWHLEGLDLATAFLQTQPTEADQELWTTGVQELREALGLSSDSVMRVLRNIYGSTTAPRGLWLSLHKTLTGLGAQAVLGERCLWVWLSKDKMDGNHPKTIGAMGGHVDDFHRIGDGSDEWLAIKERINNAYKWGMAKTGSYRHAGTDVSTVKDENGYDEIVVDQSYYIEALMDVDIVPERLRTDTALSKRDIDACRASLGALQWVAIQSQPQVCARCNLLLTDLVTNGTMETAREIQQVVSEVRQEPFKLHFKKFVKAKHWRDVVFVSMGDQAHANRPKGDSTGGLVTLLAGPESVTGCVCPMSLIGWRTWKLKRKAIGSNDAEVQSILEAEDHNFRARLLWSELHGACGHDAQRPLRVDFVDVVERQIAGIKGVLCTESRGGYDAVEVNESPLLGLSNMRAALQAFQLRGNLRRAACELRWVASDFDLADALTKKRADCREGMLKFLRTGHWCIRYDPSFTSAKKSRKAGTTAVGTVQDYLDSPHEPYSPDAAEAFWGWCNRYDLSSDVFISSIYRRM
ncbi:GIP [Symbiodinium sp. KB8]|nr:GIP [Symbiodinium sp. KB8]